MSKSEYSEEQLSEMREDAFVNIKEACMRLQERTKCGNEVVIKMLKEVSQFYISQDKDNTFGSIFTCIIENVQFIKYIFLTFLFI